MGGLIGALLTALVFYLTVSEPTACEISVSLIRWLIFAVVIVVFGTLGDLLESLLKRTVGHVSPFDLEELFQSCPPDPPH